MRFAVAVLLMLLAATSRAETRLFPPTLDRLPAGAVKPEGWLLRQAQIQAKGLTGGLATWKPGGPASSKYMPGPNTGGEEQGGEYYINGMFPLTCQIDSPALRDVRDRAVAKILRHIGRNGTIGGDIPWTAASGNKINYWGRMHAVLALESFAECEGEYAPNATMQATVEAALLRHYSAMKEQVADGQPAFWTDVWGSARYAEVLMGIQWLIDAGHSDDFLFELLNLVRTKSEEILGWEQWFQSGHPFADKTTDTIRCWGNKSDPAMREFQKHHGVTIMEALKVGAAWYRVSGSIADRNNSAVALSWIDKYARSPDGTFTAPDCLNAVVAAHVPTTGVETCSVVESMYSIRTAYEVTGEVEMFDRLERIAFNAMPATTDQNFGGNAYYHSLNQLHMSGKDGFGINGCCTGNVHQGWPKFIMSQVQTLHSDPGTIVISGYSPSTATIKDGTTIAVSGQYPFADNVTISVNRTAGKPWGLLLRIPCWVDSARVTLTDTQTSFPAHPCSLFKVPGVQASSTGFTARLEFDQSVKVLSDKWRSASPADEEWAIQAPDVAVSRPGNSARNAVEIHRGPLLFAFPVPGTVNTTVLNTTSFGMVHQTKVILDSSKPFSIALQDPNSTLAFKGFTDIPAIPFDRERPPASIKAKACEIADPSGQYAKGHVPDSPVPLSACSGGGMEVELVPIAHSYLRLAVLPVLAA